MLRKLWSILFFVLLALAAQSAGTVIELPEVAATDAPFIERLGHEPAGTNRAAATLSIERLPGLASPADLTLYVPGAYATHQFGNATTFEVRGDPVETYLNGQRRAPNLFGWQPTFNGVASIDILKGPAPVSLGPGFYSGGYANYRTKRPTSPRETAVVLELGAWLPDNHSYTHTRTRISHTQPVGKDVGFFLSYQAQESETFYADSGGRDDHQDLYAALEWKLGRWEFFLNGGILWQAKPQTLGINRPTPELMNEDHYTTGGLLDSGGDPFDPASDILLGAVIQPTGTTELPRDATLLSEGDFSNAVVWHLQLTAESDEIGGSIYTSRTLVESVDRRRYHEFSYTEYVEQFVFDQQFEMRRPDALGIPGLLTIGANLRRQSVEAFVDYFHEYLFAFDLSQPGPYRAEDFSADFAFPPGREGPGGRRFYGAEPPAGQPLFAVPESTDSNLSSFGLWLAHRIELPADITVTYGLRGDAFHAEAEDSLPPPGQEPWSDADTFTNGSATASFLWEPADRIQFYTTLARTSSVNGSLTGGSLLLYDSGLDEQDYEIRSDLLELGARFTLPRAELSLVAYHQERARQNLQGGKSDIVVEGLEAALYASPAGWLDLFVNVTYVQGHYDNAAPVELGGPSVYDSYVGGAGYNLTFGALPPDDYALPGIAPWQAASGVDLALPLGFTLRLWTRWQSDAPGNLRNEFRIPEQFELNGAITWESDSWRITFRGRNLTDRDDWIYNGSTFLNNQLVGRSEPRRFVLEAAWRR